MHLGSNGATILLYLLLFCCVFNGYAYPLKKNAPVIDVLRKRAWCAQVIQEEQFLEIDLREVETITGVATRKDDTATEFKLSYKKHNHGPWYLYEENEKEKIFRVNKKSKGHFSHHWLQHKFQARYLRFDITKWTHSICLNVEIFGWANNKMREKYRRKLPAVLQELSMQREESEEDGTVEEDSNSFDSSPPTHQTQEKESNRSLTITVCFIVAAIIAILASIIVCKWERHERKTRPDYLRPHK